MDFSLRIVSEALVSNDSKKNMITSPLSVAAMLNILTFGSGGTHLQSMLQLLGSKTLFDLKSNYSKLAAASSIFSDNCDDEDPIINFVNGAWVNQRFNIKPSFEQVLKSVFSAELKSLDFDNRKVESVNEINSWVKQSTNGLINGMVDGGDIHSATMVILANALYFKGQWMNKFRLHKPEHYFYTDKGEELLAPFMQAMYSNEYKSFETFQVASIPYKSSRHDQIRASYSGECIHRRKVSSTRGEDRRKFSMSLFLPNEKDGLPALIKEFSANPSLFLSETLSALKSQAFEEFLIPKFKFSYGFELTGIMTKLGFDLSGLTEMVNFNAFAQVFQKARIIVNEEGTEAAARSRNAIIGCGRATNPPPKRPSFVADHPFMFVIREDTTGMPFFVGVVVNPLLD